MKIGIDARCLESQRGGVAKILMDLLRLWPKMTDRHRFILYFQEDIPDDDLLRHPFFECRIIKGPRALRGRSVLTQQILMPIEINRDKPDLFFAPWYSAPLFCPFTKTVVGVWDISYHTHKRHYTLRQRLRLSFFSRNSCRRAVGIITCSHFDALQIEKHYDVPSNRICVLQLAPDNRFRPVDDFRRIERLRRKYNLPDRYILSAGVIFNRRNVDVIIDAFKEVYQDYPDIGLLVAGRNQTVPYVDIEARMKPLVNEGRGCYLPWIPEDELIYLYNGAWYYICTSTVDGESIMLKEAMRCGTPVLTSPLLKKATGGTAVIVKDPTSRRDTAEVFHKIISSRELREQNGKKGLKWVQSLSSDKTAQDCLGFFEGL